MQNLRRRITGTVASAGKMDKTVIVTVARTMVHPLYRKVTRRVVRYMAHDAENAAKVGDKVVIVESQPVSKQKRWALERILHSGPAGKTAE
ncbi:30S ribosomal protein S17 [Chloroflexota bacterium]|nr:30S ribosomal protein S17 [Chloroflexota bacterium]